MAGVPRARNGLFSETLSVLHQQTGRDDMRNLCASLVTAAAFAVVVPAAGMAQGFAVDTPVGGVRVGDPGYRHHYSDWDSPRVHRGERFHERNVYLRGNNDCRTVTIQRDDGSMKRIRRCN